MLVRPPSARVFFGLASLACVLLVPTACDEGPGRSCGPSDGSIPDPDAGQECTFPCPVAEAGDSAGGDTYANFAAPFFTAYCTRCHSTTRTSNCFTQGSATCRFGAPVGRDWDDPASVRAHLAHVRDAVGVGESLTMPPDLPSVPDPGKPAPTCEERFRLTRWIDSGAPGLP